MLVKTYCAAVMGLDAVTVTIEISMTRGVMLHLTGLADTAVKESYDRIKAAIQNNGFKMPVADLTVNLSPADIRKEGSGYDLPLAVGILAVNNKIDGYIGVDALRPYFGIGIGRAVTTDHKVSFTCDLGAFYWGKPGLFAPGEDLFGEWKDVRITAASLNGRDEGMIEKAEKLVIYPMLNFHLFFNLF